MNLSTSPVLNPPDVSYVVTSNVLDPFAAFFYSICILITAMAIHEFGHYIILRTYNKDACIEFFIKGTPQLRTGSIAGLSKQGRIRVLVGGVAAGMFIIIGAMQVHQFYTLLIAPYILGCMADIKQMIKLRMRK